MYSGSRTSADSVQSSPCFEVLESSIAKTNFPDALDNLWNKLQASIAEDELLKFAKGEIELDE
ncbi:hypothetical protein HBI56_142150 [Parastagonospora nodorum]|uniref:Uncharacterized protein n=1 Tax=Phaeosphaeria nodorum (strain SN15 / ATCC MYA-4574 / FGSC 10173) TaxID=321614 RepID=A0A7U2F856_PHANO|nr:hypothetical protein HBH56_034920 [Parastagonospora nodorum]QRD00133.1 hypothetical protein JI435_437970 [Parastagonospora nodorum SN15]KAH3934033.1 hypothetical protein HBH54_064530 [Parastagonospora nodorum]KAH3952422.1 hypothetical protein HBH53_045550 [Parastagonospora nodorum]KAH3979508.1 hypothetical protein HBH51_056560 [Parastagonospora nodorum]